MVAPQGRKISDSKLLSVEIRESALVSEVLRNTVTATDPNFFRPCGAKIKYELVLYTPGSVMKYYRNRLDSLKKRPCGAFFLIYKSINLYTPGRVTKQGR